MTRTIVLSSSRIYRSYRYAVYLLLIISIWMMPIMMSIQVVVSFLLLGVGCYHGHKIRRVEDSNQSLSIRLEDEGAIFWQKSFEQAARKYQLNQATILGFLIVLRLKGATKKTEYLVIIQDSLSTSDWRALNRFIRGQWGQ